MDINISNNKFSNVEVTNVTRISNFNFGNYDNIVYVNNILNTDNTNTFTLNQSNTTYVFGNIENFIYTKSITEVHKYNVDTFVSNNHNLKKNDIIKLSNIQILEDTNTISYINLLNNNIQNADITYRVLNVTRNTFTLETFNNSLSNLNNIKNILKSSSKYIINGSFSLVSNKSNIINDIVNINIENNNSGVLGVYYTIIIDTTIKQLKINTLNNDKLNGYITINNQEMIINDYLEISQNSNKLNISNIDLKYSKFELVNTQAKNWFLKGNIFNNIIKYELKYNTVSKDYIIDNNPISVLEFYKNYVYIIDISDSSLLNFLFIILNNTNKHHYKNIIYCGEMGYPNSFVKIYISNDEIDNTVYNLKYKVLIDNTFFNTIPFYIIKPTPIYFS
jgi:hypothetical protein